MTLDFLLAAAPFLPVLLAVVYGFWHLWDEMFPPTQATLLRRKARAERLAYERRHGFYRPRFWGYAALALGVAALVIWGLS